MHMKKCVNKTKTCTKYFANYSRKCSGLTTTSSGLGKPEPLKHTLSGLWSKRISQKDRLIYRFDDKSIYIFAIGGHYDQH